MKGSRIKIKTRVGEFVKIVLPPTKKKAVEVSVTIVSPSKERFSIIASKSITKGKSFSTPGIQFLTKGAYTLEIFINGSKKLVKVQVS